MASSLFDAQRLLNDTFVEHVEIYPSLSSTNDRALELAREETLKLPALVVAENQIAGRGQRGKTWLSAEGALTFSLIWECPAELSHAELSLLAALSVATAADASLASNEKKSLAKIKWPNDIYVNGRKLAGLLIEAPHIPFDPPRVVLGIGMNVNNSFASAGKQAFEAISLAEVAARPLSVEETLRLVLERLDDFTRPGVDKKVRRQQLSSMINQRCYLTGREIVVRSCQEDIQGICRGIGDQGCLLVELPGGSLREVAAGTVAAF